MKAVPVLLCLALARGITASIFKHQDLSVDDLDVQKLEYIDHYNQQHRNLPSETGKLRYLREQQSEEDRTHKPEFERTQEREVLRQKQFAEQSQEYRHKFQHEETKPRQQTQYSEPKYYHQHEETPYHHMNYQPSSTPHSAENNHEQYPTYKQSHHSHHKKKTHGHTDSTSNENSQSSQESHERREYSDSFKPNLRVEIRKWIPEESVGSQENQKTTYSDVIEQNAARTVVPRVSIPDNEEIEKIFGDAQVAMKHVTDEQKAKFHQAYEAAKQQQNEDVERNATQLAQKHQYPVEEHTIKTDDGYELTLFRIPPKKQIRDVQKRPVVFLMHGIDGSADDWLLMGPRKSLAYLLSDAGYDVWLGNARGNKYSRHHVSKHPAVSDFWQYGIDEIALHDLPAMIDYALETAKQEKLYYIGHAQGTTAFFALAASRPEYNAKIIMMYALSPIVYMTNVRSPLFRMISPSSKFFNYLQQQFGNGPFVPNKELIQTIGGSMLEKQIGCKEVSSNVNSVIAGVNLDPLDAQVMSVVMRHLPAGTSTKVIKHYGQAVASQEFRKYDYGPKVNVKVYGKEQPPKYDMEKVKAPVALFYSEEDWLAHPKDVERLVKELPNVKETHKVPAQHFSHMDFQFSSSAPEMVYRHLINSMQNNQ